jgi:hypothetical protein
LSCDKKNRRRGKAANGFSERNLINESEKFGKVGRRDRFLGGIATIGWVQSVWEFFGRKLIGIEEKLASSQRNSI